MKRSITDFSAEEIKTELENARAGQNGMNNSVRILFSPVCIDEENINHAASIYSRLNPAGYDTVIVVEERENALNEKLLMPSNETHQTSLGKIQVNDDLRNEFCDEDDDFFIDYSGYDRDLSLFQQLMMLQASLKNFQVLNIQISHGDEHIIKELVSAVNELLASRNILLVFCCDLNKGYHDEFGKIKDLIETDSYSKLLNLLNNSGCIKGVSAFMTGLLIARMWGTKIHFIDDGSETPSLAAYAQRERVLY